MDQKSVCNLSSIKLASISNTEESAKLLDEDAESLDDTQFDEHGSKPRPSQTVRSQCKYWSATVMRYVGMSYVSLGLTTFAIGIFLRTRSYLALLAPVACLTIVVLASEYYNLKRRGHLKRCEEAERRVKETIMTCGFRKNVSPDQNHVSRPIQ